MKKHMFQKHRELMEVTEAEDESEMDQCDNFIDDSVIDQCMSTAEVCSRFILLHLLQSFNHYRIK